MNSMNTGKQSNLLKNCIFQYLIDRSFLRILLLWLSICLLFTPMDYLFFFLNFSLNFLSHFSFSLFRLLRIIVLLLLCESVNLSLSQSARQLLSNCPASFSWGWELFVCPVLCKYTCSHAWMITVHNMIQCLIIISCEFESF